MAKKVLTDRGLKSLKPAETGQRFVYWDAALPGFGVRVTDRGAASFIVMRRITGKPTPVRRSIGSPWRVPLPHGADLPFDLTDIRTEAREAILDMAAGVDPKAKRAKKLRDVKRNEENSFGAVAEAFITEHVEKLKSASEVTAAIRREFVSEWGALPIVEVSRSEIVRKLRAVAKDRPYAAHHLLAYIRKLFNWAIATDQYGLTASPCDRIKAKDVLPKRVARDRVLSEIEFTKIWKATAKDAGLTYPLAPFARMLLLTGQRLREVADATWSEFDLEKALWVIPAQRMKGGIAHEVPLPPAAVDLLKALPRWKGPYVFSTTDGVRPISGFSKAKARLDAKLSEVEAWRWHDLRRTMRTQLGALPVPSDVAERVIAHAQPGMHKVYDLYAYRDEKRRALELWAARLLSITEKNCTANVIQLTAANR